MKIQQKTELSEMTVPVSATVISEGSASQETKQANKKG